MTLIWGSITFVGGFALCWFCKVQLTTWFTGAEATAKALEAKAAALRAKL